MFFNTFCGKALKTQCFSMVLLRDGLLRSKNKKTKCFSQLVMQKSRKLNGFAYFLVPPSTTSPGSPGSSSTAAAISKSNENTMCFNTFCGKALKTQCFSMVLLRDGLLRSKTKKTRCFSQLFMQKSRKLNGFAYFLVPPSTTSPGSPGSLSTAATISKSNENTMFFNTFCRKAVKTPGFSMVWERDLGVQSHESTKSN